VLKGYPTGDADQIMPGSPWLVPVEALTRAASSSRSTAAMMSFRERSI
jgi:hypothetical protein